MITVKAGCLGILTRLPSIFSIMIVSLLCLRCAQPRLSLETPLSYEVAVRMATHDLLVQINNQQEIIEKYKNLTFVTDTIINADTGDEIKISKQIADIVAKTAKEDFPKFSVIEMNSQNLEQANYVIIGTIKQEMYRESKAKLPHLLLSIVERATGQIKAHSEVWISSQNMDLQPTSLFIDSPMYIKDSRFNAIIAIAKSASGSVANKEYFDMLATTALLSEASNAYDNSDYPLALGLFAKAAERDDGLVMKTFTGLYQSLLKLHRPDEAEEIFGKLAALGIRSGNLSIKFLFIVNDTNFFGDSQELSEYGIWIRQLAKELIAANVCIEISGHASNSGSAEYNKKLSNKRAKAIQKKLQAIAPEIAARTSVVGRGVEENIIGTGTDDIRDAIDRRVEFKLLDCNKMSSIK
jgi:outer membrane protein OmpA-like peptidoglycan-associated protein